MSAHRSLRLNIAISDATGAFERLPVLLPITLPTCWTRSPTTMPFFMDSLGNVSWNPRPRIRFYPSNTYSRQPLKKLRAKFQVRVSKYYRMAIRLGIAVICIMYVQMKHTSLYSAQADHRGGCHRGGRYIAGSDQRQHLTLRFGSRYGPAEHLRVNL